MFQGPGKEQAMFVGATTFIALWIPTLLAVAATLLAHRRIDHPLLFFVLATFTFCWISGAAYEWIGQHFVLPPPRDMAEQLDAAAPRLFIADAISAIIGAVILWRLALALRKHEAGQP